MKNRWIKWIGVAMSIAMLMLAFAISAFAEESREEVFRGHNVDFQSLQTEKDRSSRPDYLENNYQSGFWLPFGNYKVRLAFSDDDDISRMSPSEPNLETILVENAWDITLKLSESETISAEQNGDFTAAAIREGMRVEELSSGKGAYTILGLLIVLVLGAVILFALVVHRRNSDEE